MADAVTVRVDIDARLLGDKLTKAVTRAVRPALAQLNADLNKQFASISAGLGKTTTNAKTLGAALKDVNRETSQLNKGLKAVNEGTLGRATQAARTHRDTLQGSQRAAAALNRELARVGDSGLRKATRALTAFVTEAQQAAAATRDVDVNVPDRGPRRGRPKRIRAPAGGGIPDLGLGLPSKDYTGILGQISLGWDKFLSQLVLAGGAISTLSPVIGALGGAIGVLGGGVGAAVGGIGQLTAGVFALGPAIGGVVAAAKIGFAGLEEGAKAFMAQFEDQNKILAAQIGNLMGPLLQSWQEVSSRIKLDFAQALVPSFNNLGALVRTIGPQLSGIATTFAGVANNVTGTLNALGPQINTILEGSKTLLSAVGPGVQVLVRGIVEAGAAAQQAMPAIGAAIGGALSQIGAALSTVAASPQLQQALTGFAQVIGQVGTLLAGLIPTLIQVGATVGPVFAQMIGALGPALNQILITFGELGRDVGPLFNQLLAAIGPALSSVLTGLGQMAQAIGPTLPTLLLTLANALQPLYTVLGQLGQGFVEQLIAILPTLGTALANLIGPLTLALPQAGALIVKLAEAVNTAAPAIVRLAEDIGVLLNIAINLLEQLTPVLNLLARFPVLIDAVVVAFVAWKTIAGIQALTTALNLIVTMLAVRIPAAAAVGAAGITAQLAAVSVPAWLAFLVAGGSVAALGEGFRAAQEAGAQPGLSRFPERKTPGLSRFPERKTPGLPTTTPGGGGLSRSALDALHGTDLDFALVPEPLAPMFAGPQPFTPVAPDLGKAGAGAGPAISADDLPLDVIAKTPDQVKLLTDIRNLLAGTGNASAPLNTLKDLKPAVQTISEDLKKTLPPSRLPPGAVPERMGPFGTPIPARHPGYDVAAAVIQSLGGDPLRFIGQNPIDYAMEQWTGTVDDWRRTTDQQIDTWQQQTQDWTKQFTAGAPGGVPPIPGSLPPLNLGGGLNWDALAREEASGNWANKRNPKYMGGLQFDQETWNANKPPGAPANPADATREQQIQAGMNALQARGGPQTLWPQNWQKLYEGTGITPGTVPPGGGGLPGPTAPGLPGPNISTSGAPIPVWVVGTGPLPNLQPGAAPAAPATVVPPNVLGGLGQAAITPSVAGTFSGGGLEQAIAVARSGTAYNWGGVGKGGLYDCSGFISDIYAALTGKPYSGNERYFTTTSNFTGLGFQPGFDPRSVLNISTTPSHMAGILAGIPIEASGPEGAPPGAGGPTFGAPARGTLPGGVAYHLPIGFDLSQLPPGALAGATAPGLPGPNLATAGAPIPVFVTNWPAALGGQVPGPFGTPVTPGAQAQQALGMLDKNLIGPATAAAGQAAGDVTSDVLSAIGGVGLESWVKRRPTADLENLVQEGNVLAGVQAAGLANIQDFTRAGGIGQQAIAPPPSPGFDATGRVFSDVSALLDRTFTSLSAQLEAMRTQLVDATNQVRSRLTEEALLPVLKTGVAQGFEAIKTAAFSEIGTALGTAAGPPIAQEVGSAVSSATSGGGTGIGPAAQELGTQVIGGVFDEGGPWPTHTIGANLSGATERVLSPADTRLFEKGLLGGWNLPSRQFATVGGQVGNATVGAEFFGVSQIPILGAIINVIIRVLLQVIGVEIKIRDTLSEMTDEFRQFRGDAFKAFDAQGRLLSDTSGLIDRSLSSQEAVAEERIRILKIVIAALVKYIIEKVIVPIAKAVANAAIQAGASAAGAATNMGAPGAGGIVSSVISSAGQAGVDIIAEVGTDLALAATDVLTDAITEGIRSLFPELTSGLFGGGGAAMLADPVGLLVGNLLGGSLQAVTGGMLGGLLGALAAMLLGLIGGASFGGGFGGMGGGLFDEGGLARGVGFMPKATLAPERVLSPRETAAFERLVDVLEHGAIGNRTTTMHANFHVAGGREAADLAHNRLLALLS